MRIINKEEYDKIPNGAELKLFLSGSKWDENFGECAKVMKVNNRLYEVKDGYWDFNEKDDKGYEFELAYNNDSFI